VTSFERFLTKLDVWPNGALLRVGVGLCVLPVLRLLPGGDRIWIGLLLFVVLLLALRLVPAVLRRVFPFSRAAKDVWFQRRNLAKRYDSYQWQKLFWMGLGMLACALATGRVGSGEIVLLAICLIGGGAGLVFWRKAGVDRPDSGAIASSKVATSTAVAPAPR
jgi:hypothetical protein